MGKSIDQQLPSHQSKLDGVGARIPSFLFFCQMRISLGEKVDLFMEHFPQMGETYSSKFSFIGDIGASCDAANADLLAKYATSEEEQAVSILTLGPRRSKA